MGSGVDAGSGVGIGVGTGVTVGTGVSLGVIVAVGGTVRSSPESVVEHATIAVTIASIKKKDAGAILFHAMFFKLVNQVSFAVTRSAVINIYDVFQCG